MNESLYDGDVQPGGEVGETWYGGFPDELKSDLKEIGFDDPENDLGQQGVSDFGALRTEWGDQNFVPNMKVIKETLALLPKEVQEKYEKKPALLNSPHFLKDVARVLQQNKAEHEARQAAKKGGLDFKDMEGLTQVANLRDIQSRLSLILFQHDSRMAAEANKEGRSW